MKKHLYLLAIIIMAITLLLGCKRELADQHIVNKDAQNNIFAYLTKLSDANNFNGNVFVAKNGVKMYEGSFGYSDGNKKPLQLTDQFNIGSIYKELPGIAIMQLEEAGRVTLDGPIAQHFPLLPAWAKEVTIKHLFQYSSGLPRVNVGAFKEINDKVLMESLIKLDALQSVPSKEYEYSNYNPFLLAKIVEAVSGQTFVSYVQDNILVPNDMKHSGFNKSFPYVDRHLMAHPFDDEYKEDVFPFVIQAPVFLFRTSTADLFALVENLHASKIISTNSVITLSQTAPLDVEGMQSPLGNVRIKVGKIVVHRHHGSSGNYESLIVRNNETGITIIILTNRKNKNLHEIADMIASSL